MKIQSEFSLSVVGRVCEVRTVRRFFLFRQRRVVIALPPGIVRLVRRECHKRFLPDPRFGTMMVIPATWIRGGRKRSADDKIDVELTVGGRGTSRFCAGSPHVGIESFQLA